MIEWCFRCGRQHTDYIKLNGKASGVGYTLDRPFSEKKGFVGEAVCDKNVSIFLGQCEELCCLQKVEGESRDVRGRNKDGARSQTGWGKLKNIGRTGRILVKPEELENYACQ